MRISLRNRGAAPFGPGTDGPAAAAWPGGGSCAAFCARKPKLAYFPLCCKIGAMSRFRFLALMGAQLLPLCLAPPSLSAQGFPQPPLPEAQGAGRAASPAVASGIQAQSDGTSVTLSWQPSPGQGGVSVVLRHVEPIAASNYAQAEIVAELEAGESRLVDAPSEGGAFYYAVVPRSAETGEIQPLFVPSENATVFPIEVAAPEENAGERVIFFGIVPRNQAVVISWETAPYGRSVIIYRSTQPFEDITALARATIVAAGAEAIQPYVDYPVPGVPYYYAVVPESVVRSGSVAFRYGENTNEIPVEALGEYAGAPSTAKSSVRDIPLPRLNIPGTGLPAPIALSDEAERAVADIASIARRGQAASESRKARDIPFRFPEDTAGISGGEEAALKSILDRHFESGDWQALASELSRFLSLRRADGVAARARFYLGEARYFLGNYSEALEAFLLTRDAYPAKAAEWIQKTLKKLS